MRMLCYHEDVYIAAIAIELQPLLLALPVDMTNLVQYVMLSFNVHSIESVSKFQDASNWVKASFKRVDVHTFGTWHKVIQQGPKVLKF